MNILWLLELVYWTDFYVFTIKYSIDLSQLENMPWNKLKPLISQQVFNLIFELYPKVISKNIYWDRVYTLEDK